MWNYDTQNLRIMVSYFNITDSYHISGSLLQVARTKTVTSDHLITFID